MQNQINNYLNYCLIEKNQSAKTIETRRAVLTAFAVSCGTATPSGITSAVVSQYRKHLFDRGLKPATINVHLIALRQFLKFCAKSGSDILPADTIELAKLPQVSREILDIDEVEKVIAAADNLRDRCLLEVLLATGLRVSELCSLTRTQLRFDEFSVLGKGSKIRPVFINKRCRMIVDEFLKQNNFERPFDLNPRQVQRIVRRCADTAGITKAITPHIFRHTWATNMLSRGADIRVVQELLGHSSILTTQIYTHITNLQLREAYARYNN